MHVFVCVCACASEHSNTYPLMNFDGVHYTLNCLRVLDNHVHRLSTDLLSNRNWSHCECAHESHRGQFHVLPLLRQTGQVLGERLQVSLALFTWVWWEGSLYLGMNSC